MSSSSYGTPNGVPAASGAAGPVERFRPSNGQALGWTAVAVALLAAVWVVVEEPTGTAVTVALGLVAAATVVWMVMLRPRAYADRRTLVLRGATADTHVPLHLVEAVDVRQVLVVHAGDRRYSCTGIGRTTRQMMGRGRPRAADTPAGDTAAAGVAERYDQYVAHRISDLAATARRDADPAPGEQVRRRWAWPELAVLATSGLGFLLSLAL